MVSPDTTECCIVNNTIDTTREHPLRGHQPTKKQFPYFLGKEEAGYVLATQRPPAGTRPICGSNGRRSRGPPPPRRPPIRLVRRAVDALCTERGAHFTLVRQPWPCVHCHGAHACRIASRECYGGVAVEDGNPKVLHAFSGKAGKHDGLAKLLLALGIQCQEIDTLIHADRHNLSDDYTTRNECNTRKRKENKKERRTKKGENREQPSNPYHT